MLIIQGELGYRLSPVKRGKSAGPGGENGEPMGYYERNRAGGIP